MLVFCVINVLSAVYSVRCGVPAALNTNEPIQQQLKALEHVHAFLRGVQREIKESRYLLRHIHFDNPVNYSAPSRASSVWTVKPQLSRYLLPTESPYLLRTNSAQNSSISTTSTFTREPNPNEQRAFQNIRDYVIPDYALEYRDIFAPELQRGGDGIQTTLPSIAVSHLDPPASQQNSKLPQQAQATTGGGNTNQQDQIMKLFGTDTTPLIRGDVFYGDVLTDGPDLDPHPTLHAQLENASTGYLSFGFETLCRLIVENKEEKHIMQVLQPSESVIVRMNERDHTKFAFMEEPMYSIFLRVANWVSDPQLQIDELLVSAKLMLGVMQSRHEFLSEEVNHIIDFADGLVKQDDGDRILDVLDDFWRYPNLTRQGINKTGEELCEDFINAFSKPYDHYCTDRVRLINSANRALRERIPQNGNFRREAFKRFGGGGHSRLRRITRKYKHTFRSFKKGVYSTRPSTLHRNFAQRRTRYDLDFKRQKYSYNKLPPLRRFAEVNDVNKYVQHDYNNKNKYNTTERTVNKKFKNTQNVMLRNKDETVKKSEQIQRGKSNQIKQNVITKRIKYNTKPKRQGHLEPNQRQTDSRRANIVIKNSKGITNTEQTITTANTNEIKMTNTVNLATINKTEINKDFLNESDENVLLDEKALNRLLNITSEESLTDEKQLDESVETADDEEMLRRLSDVLYAE